jgi:hypothetical protein
MAHFIATVAGQSGPASRIGSPRSGIAAHPRGWDIGVEVVGTVENGEDIFRVYVTGGSNGHTGRVYIGTARNVDGIPQFVAADRGMVLA